MISSFYEKIVGSSTILKPSMKILCVGLTCLDIVQTCKQFPAEDSDQRSEDYRWQRGGNASNTCTVLSILGSSCEFFGTLSAEEHLNILQNDMRKYNIDFSHCPMVEGIGCPTSTVILSLSTGSRTILHHNPNLPELTLENFEGIRLEEYSWVHFEGRNLNHVLSMMQRIENYNNSLNSSHDTISNEKTSAVRMPITISVELERPRGELLDLLPYVDVAFISKEFAQSRGYDNMSETLRNISDDSKTGATIICAWGDRGAMARTPDNTVVQSPAFPPQKIVDTLGAGDTFIATVLHSLNQAKLDFIKNETVDHLSDTSFFNSRVGRQNIKHNYNIESSEFSRTEFINERILLTAVTFGCRVAGRKVGLKGYEGLKTIFNSILES